MYFKRSRLCAIHRNTTIMDESVHGRIRILLFKYLILKCALVESVAVVVVLCVFEISVLDENI